MGSGRWRPSLLLPEVRCSPLMQRKTRAGRDSVLSLALDSGITIVSQRPGIRAERQPPPPTFFPLQSGQRREQFYVPLMGKSRRRLNDGRPRLEGCVATKRHRVWDCNEMARAKAQLMCSFDAFLPGARLCSCSLGGLLRIASTEAPRVFNAPNRLGTSRLEFQGVMPSPVPISGIWRPQAGRCGLNTPGRGESGHRDAPPGAEVDILSGSEPSFSPPLMSTLVAQGHPGCPPTTMDVHFEVPGSL